MKKLIVNPLLLIAFSFLAISSCKKEDTSEQESSATEASRDNAQAENVFDDVSQQIDETAMRSIYLDPQTTLSSATGCPAVTIDFPNTTTWPKVVTIDYGTSNCTNTNGVSRRGQIIATFSGPYRATGTIISITFNNYYVNDNKVEGLKTITNGGLNSSGQMFWNINVQNAKITRTDSSYVTWNSTRVRTWTAGQSTYGIRLDDVFEVSGSATGGNSNGNSYTSTITSPLYIAFNCRWIEAGIIKLTPSNRPARTIDFGVAGNCDDQATVVVNGKSYAITLRN
jgi:hypothetical protein